MEPRARRPERGPPLHWALLVGVPVVVALGAWYELRKLPSGGSASVGSGRPDLHAAESAVRQGAAIPGLLRIGCTDPAVADDEAMERLQPGRNAGVATIPTVLCKVPRGAHRPTCDEVAREYLRAKTPRAPYFNAVVLELESGATVCEKRVLPDGTDFDAGRVEVTPGKLP